MELEVDDSVVPLNVALQEVPEGRPDSENVTVYVVGLAVKVIPWLTSP